MMRWPRNLAGSLDGSGLAAEHADKSGFVVAFRLSRPFSNAREVGKIIVII